MKLLSFSSYDEYRQIQVAANKLKYHEVYAEDTELRSVAAHLARHHGGARRGLCHGVRNGYEVHKLRALLPAVDIVGTDISDTASGLSNCIVWDMHDVKPEWIGAIDFIYSNSWDHTYDPRLLFASWGNTLSPSGRIYLSYTALHAESGVSASSKVDVFGCSLAELIDVAGQTLDVEEVIDVRPRVTVQALRRRMAHLRAGKLRRALTARYRSRPVKIVVLRRRSANAPASDGPGPVFGQGSRDPQLR